MVCSVSGCALLHSGTVSPSSSSVERASESSPILSGLYSYHIPTNTWTKLRDIQLEPQPKLGQSMIFHPVCMHFTAWNPRKHRLCTFSKLFFVKINQWMKNANGIMLTVGKLKLSSSNYRSELTMLPSCCGWTVETVLRRMIRGVTRWDVCDWVCRVDVQTQRCLYIFGGERNRDHLNDIWLYYVNSNEIQHIADVYCKDSLRGQ